MTTTKPKTELMLSENKGYEKVSGASNSRKELNQMLSGCRSGDTVCVVRLDRLGRRMMKLAEMITDFKLKGRVGGRPKALTPEKVKQLQRLKKSGEFSVAQICHLLGISRSVYYRATIRKGDIYTNNAIQ